MVGRSLDRDCRWGLCPAARVRLPHSDSEGTLGRAGLDDISRSADMESPQETVEQGPLEAAWAVAESFDEAWYGSDFLEGQP